MPVTSITPDPDALTLTVVADYGVPVDRLWAAWADARQLERFWGPPQWPATFTRHDMAVGGRSEYHMTGPKSECSRGYWIFEEVDPPRAFAVRDGFASEDGSPNDELPGSRMRIQFEPTASGSRFVCVSTFASLTALEQLVAMGMVEGLRSALAQLDATLEDLRASTASVQVEIVDDTHVRITREVRGALAMIWRAHQEAALMKRWMLGPDGWTMPVCEIAMNPGDTYRYEWEDVTGANRFGFTGELLESEAPRRAVSTELMIGMPGPGTVNELILEPPPWRTHADHPEHHLPVEGAARHGARHRHG
jgi:uncharacterized protein YndB with AHSA1/START domain